MDFSKIKSISIPEGSAKELSIGGVKVWSSIAGLVYVLSDDGTYYECRGPSNKKVTEVVIDSEINGIPVTEIDASAFYNCRGITNVVIPDSITSIGGGAFASCTNLKSVVIGKGVTRIPNGMFDYCGSLESVEIPNTVTYIDSEAFSRCTSLTSILIPISVTTILVDVFKGCTNLNTIYCEATSKPTLWVTTWNYDETNKRYIDVVWSEPEEPEEPDTPEVEDELQGLWILNKDMNVASLGNSEFELNFYRNDTEGVMLGHYEDYFASYLIGRTSSGTNFGVYEGECINILSKLSEVENGSTLLSWLKFNGKKIKSQATSKEVQCSLLDTYVNQTETITFRQGMTWAEFNYSKYNTNFHILTGNIRVNEPIDLANANVHLNDKAVNCEDFMIEDQYTFSSKPMGPGGSGGGAN